MLHNFIIFITGAKFTTSRFGRPALMLNNYRYNLYVPYHTRDKINTARKEWRCVKWRSTNCRAGIITIDNVIVKTSHGHNHWIHQY